MHVDYTVKSGPERLQAVLPDEAERLMKTPFAVIQVSLSCNKLRQLLDKETPSIRILGVFRFAVLTMRSAAVTSHVSILQTAPV